MFKKIITFIFFLTILIAFSFFVIKNDLLDLGLEQIPKIERSITNGLIDVEKKISNPPPLIGKENAPDSFLTKEGVLSWTNIQRDETESLPALFRNNKLDAIAMERLEDMFERQYFEHISPDGTGASDVAKDIGYEFISIGENIALGNFKDDQTLVQAWMDSPGHRANILNDNYTEIGIAVKKDLYEERETWIGVQIFARPLSDCPQIDQDLKTEIERVQNQIAIFEDSSSSLRREIEDMDPKSRKDIKTYNKKIDEYNGIVKEINNLISTQKNLILKYNNQVDSQNKCIQK
ncbi:MAG: CAP domain-containing protein [Candidatus Pacebacteria bacterium]|nr:CAP domain-containing protein [Candidatus Paceibacterota bacterium]